MILFLSTKSSDAKFYGALQVGAIHMKTTSALYGLSLGYQKNGHVFYNQFQYSSTLKKQSNYTIGQRFTNVVNFNYGYNIKVYNRFYVMPVIGYEIGCASTYKTKEYSVVTNGVRQLSLGTICKIKVSEKYFLSLEGRAISTEGDQMNLMTTDSDQKFEQKFDIFYIFSIGISK